MSASPTSVQGPDTATDAFAERVMKAVTLDRYGPPEVLKLADIPRPEPSAGEVLVEVRAASVNAGDWHLMRGEPFVVRLMFGLTKPKVRVLGTDVAGRVLALGPGVTRFRVGDEVFGDLSASGFGSFAEAATAAEDALVLKPVNLSFADAAAVPSAGLTALQGLRKHGGLKAGQRVLVTGASGGVGGFAVQLAHAFGAEVTALSSASKAGYVSSLGANQVLDYRKQDVTRLPERFDLILDAAAFRPPRDYARILSQQGRYVLVGGASRWLFQVMLFGRFLARGSQQFKTFIAKPVQDDLLLLHDLLETGKLKPAIDKSFPLAETAEAVRALESRQVRGKVVVTV